MMKKYCIISAVIALLFTFSIFIAPAAYADEKKVSGEDTSGEDFKFIETIAAPAEIMDLKAKSAMLVEASTGNILYEKNSHEKLAPASITKIMSILLVMEAIESGKIKLDDMVSVSEHARSMGGSQVWLDPREKMSVHELLKTVVVASANDGTVALAEHVAGSEEAFVELMNQKAKGLGMNDTNFINSTGLDAENHHTSAYDIALMSRELLNKHPQITEYTKIWIDSIRDGKFGLSNTNKLIRFFKGANGLKTGSTPKAGFCISASAKRNNLQLIAVIMATHDAKTRFAEAAKLLSYGFANYVTINIASKGDFAQEAGVLKGITGKVRCVYPTDVNLLLGKGQTKNITKEIKLVENLTAPVLAGQKTGEVIFRFNGQVVGKTDIVAETDVKKASFLTLFFRMILSWFGMGRKG